MDFSISVVTLVDSCAVSVVFSIRRPVFSFHLPTDSVGTSSSMTMSVVSVPVVLGVPADPEVADCDDF